VVITRQADFDARELLSKDAVRATNRFQPPTES
jgi:hypothetical protein